MSVKVEWTSGDPRCPCGSSKFDATFELLGAGQWKIETIYCFECNERIKVTKEFESFLRGEKWTVRQP